MSKKVLVKGYVVGMIQTNVYFVHREGRSEALLVDPADYGSALVQEAKKQGLSIAAILLTHAHFDHIGGVREAAEETGAKIYISDAERLLIRDTSANLSADYHRALTVEPDVFLRDQETVELAGMTVQCLSTPGHTEGSCCYYIEDTGCDEKGSCPPILFSGDTLFEESVGRTDFPTGSMSALVRSVREKLFPLPEETLVYPGHGGMTTIGHEKQFNAMV